MSRERCKQCGCFLAFDMGQEGDGDFYCNNQNCKVNTEDWRVNFNDNKKVIELTEDDIGRWVTYDNGFDTERGRIKSFNNEIGIAFVVYKANGNWDLYHWKDYTAQATRYIDLSWA